MDGAPCIKLIDREIETQTIVGSLKQLVSESLTKRAYNDLERSVSQQDHCGN